jgi:hypothetical protein
LRVYNHKTISVQTQEYRKNYVFVFVLRSLPKASCTIRSGEILIHVTARDCIRSFNAQNVSSILDNGKGCVHAPIRETQEQDEAAAAELGD